MIRRLSQFATRLFAIVLLATSIVACNMSNLRSSSPNPDDSGKPDETNIEKLALDSTLENSKQTSPLKPKNPQNKEHNNSRASSEDKQTSETDLWERLRQGYQLPIIFNERVSRELKRYSKHQKYMDKVVARAEPYLFHILEELERRNMPSEIALLPVVESAFDPFAYSHGRASGIWQIIPGTGKMLGLKQNWWYDGRRDVLASTKGALDYLEQLNKRFDGDWLLALAAYNSGGGNVSKALKKNKRLHKELDFWSLDLPKETKDYVPRLVALTLLVSSPITYNIKLKDVRNKPYFAKVDIDSQIDLAQAASLAGIDMDELYRLNPALNQWATDPNGPHHLLIPINKANDFKRKLRQIPAEKRITWHRYKIRRGDSLSSIAKKNHISVSALKDVNDLNSTKIVIGQTIMVPKSAQPGTHYSKSVSERLAKNRANASKQSTSNKVSYLVKSGDNLWDISRKYGVTTKQLTRWNSSVANKPIRPGQRLVIWTKNKNDIAATDINKIRKVSYKVRKGDSLSQIASKFNVAVKDIVNWNRSASRKYIQPGQAITLFVDITKSAGR